MCNKCSIKSKLRILRQRLLDNQSNVNQKYMHELVFWDWYLCMNITKNVFIDDIHEIKLDQP